MDEIMYICTSNLERHTSFNAPVQYEYYKSGYKVIRGAAGGLVFSRFFHAPQAL